jgi:hypothetical protein
MEKQILQFQLIIVINNKIISIMKLNKIIRIFLVSLKRTMNFCA